MTILFPGNVTLQFLLYTVGFISSSSLCYSKSIVRGNMPLLLSKSFSWECSSGFPGLMPVHSETSLTPDMKAEAASFAGTVPALLLISGIHIFGCYFIHGFYKSSLLFSSGGRTLSLLSKCVSYTFCHWGQIPDKSNLGQEGFIRPHKGLCSIMAEMARQWRLYGRQECEAAVAHISVDP